MSIRWRLFASHFAAIVAVVAVLGAYLSREIAAPYIESMESSLLHQARLIGEDLGGDFAAPQGRDELQASARRLAGEVRARITLIAPDGVVLADSARDIRALDNHAARPEVRQALSSGAGRSLRHSASLRRDMMYVAVAVKRHGAVVGVVRVATPLRRAEAALGRIRARIWAAALAAVGAALLLSAALAHQMGRAVRALGDVARSLAAGDLDARARVRGSPEIAALAAAFNDMAGRLRLIVREAQRDRQEVLAILGRLGDAVLVCDTAGRITLCNAAAERAFGISASSVQGLTVVDATQNNPLDEAFRAALSTGGTVTTEVQVVFPDARVLEATVTAVVSEEPLGAVAVMHDVTELRRLENVRREFVANASHELQTPITAIKAVAETLLTGHVDDPEAASRFLDELVKQADRLAALVRDLLDLAAIESGEGGAEIAEGCVAETARAVRAELRALAEQRRIALAVDVPEDLTVRADPEALARIVGNLLDNAVKYTEPGGKAGVRAECEGDSVRITVWDTGIGIPSTDLPHVFERFYRVDKARSRELGGTGLGLSIVMHLTESLGGTVSAESELGKGSRFTVVLPATVAAGTGRREERAG